jgi:primosomal protein N' (replication factor Y)
VTGSADDAGLAEEAIRELSSVLDDGAPFLPDAIVDLALWVAEYYLAGPGEALSTAMPPFAWVESQPRYELTPTGVAAAEGEHDESRARILRKLARGPKAARALAPTGAGRSPVDRVLRALERDGLVSRVQMLVGRAKAFRTEMVATLTAAGLSQAHADPSVPSLLRGPKQQAAIEALAGAPGGLSTSTLRSRGVDLAALRRLGAHGLLRLTEERRERDPFAADTTPPAADPARTLTPEQDAALVDLKVLLDEGEFHTALLHGVTGSGKTELYLRLAAHAIEAGRRVLILVPEIALTPQMVGQVRAVFGDRVAIQHSGLADGERHDQWHRIRGGAVDLVVGTRSAVFTPLANLGLLIVDEEHDSSYKQEETPRYHARDVAVVRARQAGALVVLGSATPSLETYHNAETGRYARAVLRRRVLDRPLADVQVVDMRDEYAAAGPDVILSARLVDAIGRRMAAGEQSLLLLNRRGFATTVFCRQCGHSPRLPELQRVVDRASDAESGARAVCHYCNYSVRVPTACEKCAAPYLEQAGFGTERVEDEVRRLFETARVGRVDRDTMQRRGAIQKVLHEFRTGALDLLVGHR